MSKIDLGESETPELSSVYPVLWSYRRKYSAEVLSVGKRSTAFPCVQCYWSFKINIKSKNANQNQINTTTSSKREMMEEEVRILNKVKPSIADLIPSPERLTHTPSSELISLASKTNSPQHQEPIPSAETLHTPEPMPPAKRKLAKQGKKKTVQKRKKSARNQVWLIVEPCLTDSVFPCNCRSL